MLPARASFQADRLAPHPSMGLNSGRGSPSNTATLPWPKGDLLMRTKIYLAAIFTGVIMTAYAFLQPGVASAGDGGKNLKILPATMSKQDIKKLMKGVADSLGVQCDFCHD